MGYDIIWDRKLINKPNIPFGYNERYQIEPTTTNLWDIPILYNSIVTYNFKVNNLPDKQTNEWDRIQGEENNTLIKLLRHSPGFNNKV